MQEQSLNKKRIAKNTLLLYFRMLFLMLISLYTSRVTLQALGINDFGIYNAVGGLVAMFSILSGSLSASISRFITYELGQDNFEKLKKIFSSALTVQLSLVFCVILFAEVIGVWFLNTQMSIPEDRMEAANWVLQFTILTFSINLINIPFHALIISHERMGFFAYVSIFEAFGKLLIVYMILHTTADRLIVYSFMIGLISFITTLVYWIYCRRQFVECVFHFIWDKLLLKQMLSFAGWNFIGSTAAILRDQGGNIVINIFCGPAVNAARAIAFQVNGAILGFVTNFMTALNPQITKSYAAGEHSYMISLVYQGARLSFYMLLLLSLPVLLNTHYILQLWLDIVPEHSVAFVRLTLIFALSESISNPLITVMLATGRIRNYQIVVGGLSMLNFPLSYLFLKLGFVPEVVFVVAIIMSQFCFIVRLYMLRGMVKLSIRDYFARVYINVLLVSAVSLILPLGVSYLVEQSLVSFVGLSVLSLCTTSLVILFVGCTQSERSFILTKIGTKFFNRFK